MCSDGVCVDAGPTTGVTTTSATTGSTTEGMSSTSGSTISTSGDPGSCDPNDGLENPDCPESTPYCSASGVCGDCSVLVSCADVSANKAVCDLVSGDCVECTTDEDSACGGDTPVCDELVGECMGCTEHAHCPDSACEMKSGKCLDPDKLLYIYSDSDNSGNCTEQVGLGGTMDTPYCSVGAAMAHAKENGGLSGSTFKIIPGGPLSQAALTLDDSQGPLVLALVADSNPSSAAEFRSSFAVLSLEGDVTLYLNNLDIISDAVISDQPIVSCIGGAELDISNSRLREGLGPGIRADSCDIKLRSTSVTQNKSEGLELVKGSLWMRNTFITDNGSHPQWGGGGLSLDKVDVDIVYSTIVNNKAPEGADSISCTFVTGAHLVRNSIIAHNPENPNPSVACIGLTIYNSLVDGGESSGEGNMKRAAEDILDLLKAENTIGVYRIIDAEAASMMDGVAKWSEVDGDPRVDFEGDMRSLDAGAFDSPGADLFVE
ncbi:MAG TPA: hypothetical protein ENJ18_08415 [Nannocystis exedens]|nr:hypothetical protein [Nannocystis exedens]